MTMPTTSKPLEALPPGGVVVATCSEHPHETVQRRVRSFPRGKAPGDRHVHVQPSGHPDLGPFRSVYEWYEVTPRSDRSMQKYLAGGWVQLHPDSRRVGAWVMIFCGHDLKEESKEE